MSLATIVKGNTFSLAIPLQVYAVEDGEVVLRDYTPESGDAITVRLKGERRNYTYIPSTNGNTAFIHLEGSEVVGMYAVEVEIVKDDDSKLTSMRFDQLSIVESIDELNEGQITEGISQGAIYLDPEIFIAGKDGRGIVSITLTGTSGLVDTYTITYTDNTTSTFTVTNGEDGRSEQSDWAQTDPSADDYIKNKPSLATVATSGSYNDLLNKPTIPTVNNATLTIQKNGTTVNTFTANASSNVTANITVPTKVSDLTNDSGFITSYTETDPVFSASAAASITSSDITAWNNKQNALTFDTAPTASSTNPVTSGGVKTALDAKQATLVSGTSIKTVNNTSLLGSGNVAVQPTLVSGTNIKTVNSTSLLGSGDVTINGSNVNYTGSTGNVITANTSVNTALAAIDTAIGNIETLLANI